jgi:hypothetical protein
MSSSPHPLYGLVHIVDVIRKADADDGAGGIVPDGAETTVYADRRCRCTLLSPEEEMKEFGQAGGKHWRVLMEHSPNVREADFLRIPWGNPANNRPPVLATVWPTWGKVMTPAGVILLETDAASPPTYTDDTGDYGVGCTDMGWVLSDLSGEDSVGVFLGGLVTDNPWLLSGWPAVGNESGYWLVEYGWAALDYRVVYAKDQIDEVGGFHHTSVVMELED